MRLLRVRGLAAHAGATRLVHGIDLDLAAGRVVTLLGRSGAGKTTVGAAIAGATAPGIRVTGEVTVRAPDGAGVPVGYLPQHAAGTLNPARRIGAALAELIALHEQPGRASRAGRVAHRRAAVALLRRAAFDEPDEQLVRLLRRYPVEFSGGQRTRLALAQVLAARPAVLVLDEPTTGLDPLARSRFMAGIRAQRAAGTAILLITHDERVAELGDEVVTITDGTLAEPPTTVAAGSDGTPPGFDGTPPGFDGTPPGSEGMPPGFDGTPPGFDGTPPGFDGSPPGSDGTPPGSEGMPVGSEGMPAGHTRTGTVPRSALADSPAAAPASRSAEPTGHRAVCPGSGGDGRAAGGTAAADAVVCGEPHGGEMLALRGVSVARRRTVVLRDVDLVLRPGELHALLGVSGAGKSTLARIVAGLVRADAGTVLVGGRRFPLLRRRSRQQLGFVQYVWQEAAASFEPRRRVLDQVATTAVRLRRLAPAAARAEALAELTGLGLSERQVRRVPAGLSGGQLQRAAVARALLAAPRLVLCDEVTTGLDRPLAEAILDRLDRYRRDTGAAVLAIGHDVPALLARADTATVLSAGRVVATGRPADLTTDPDAPSIVDF